jgi:ribosomal protein S28E/S33
MAERSGIPGMSDLMNEDPDLQRLIAQKMAAKMGGLGQFMNVASGFGAPEPMNSSGPAPMSMGAPPPSPPRNGASGRTPFNVASAAAGGDGGGRIRREMRGPVGVDDILKAFETERLMQTAGGPPVSSSHAGVFAPNGAAPPSSGGVSILREGVGSMSDPMADFLGGGDDGASFMSGSTVNTERRRGRKRAVATPVGATLDLNV